MTDGITLSIYIYIILSCPSHFQDVNSKVHISNINALLFSKLKNLAKSIICLNMRIAQEERPLHN